MITLNINEVVQVKLTDAGREELLRQIDEFNKEFPKARLKRALPHEDKEGWSKFQLLDLMNRLGHMLSLCCEIPFEDDIKIKE